MAKIIKGRLLSLKQTGGSNVGAKHCLLEIEGDKPRRVLVSNKLLSFFSNAHTYSRVIEVELIGVGLGPVRSGVSKISFEQGGKLVGKAASPVSYVTNFLIAAFCLVCAFFMFDSGDSDFNVMITLFLLMAAWHIWPLISYASVSKTGFEKV